MKKFFKNTLITIATISFLVFGVCERMDTNEKKNIAHCQNIGKIYDYDERGCIEIENIVILR